jgi:DNA replication protein DnaC
MFKDSTLDLMRGLGLHGMAEGYTDLDAQIEARKLDHHEWLAMLLEREKELRQQRRFESRVRAARLRLPRSVGDVEDCAVLGMDPAFFLELAAGDWIRGRHNLLITGSSGVGKSWLARALGYRALIGDFSVGYHRLPRLLAKLSLARLDGGYNRMLRAIARLDVLILDDWGPESFDVEQRRDLLEIIEDRYESRSTIVASQLPLDRWYGLIGNPATAVAILDRVAHNSYRIELKGESLRQRQTQPPPIFAVECDE